MFSILWVFPIEKWQYVCEDIVYNSKSPFNNFKIVLLSHACVLIFLLKIAQMWQCNNLGQTTAVPFLLWENDRNAFDFVILINITNKIQNLTVFFSTFKLTSMWYFSEIIENDLNCQ